jgi:acetoacetyl-CoA synthetase
MNAPLWIPSPERAAAAHLTHFIAQANDRHGLSIADYDGLHRWSIDEPGDFWSLVWDYVGVVGAKGEGPYLDDPDALPGARWFPQARLNFAENLLRRRDEGLALVSLREDGLRRTVSFAELHAMTARLAQAMQAAGVGVGDRVAGYMPNIPEAVAAMLATTALGAIWTCVAPEYGVSAAVDRLGQVAPKLLISADGYLFGGKSHDLLERLRAMSAAMPSLEAVVVVGELAEAPALDGIRAGVAYRAFVAPFAAGEIAYERLAFDHPALILFSSGTTGAPKCILHGAGGALLENLKAHVLQFDVRADDKIYWACPTGWVVWNIALMALGCGATVILYDGSASYPNEDQLVRQTAEERASFARWPARYVDGLAKAGAQPGRNYDLSALRTLMCNGSVFLPEGYAYVYEQVKADLHLVSPAGGTDSCGSLVSADPIGPVWAGEIQGPALGFSVAVFDAAGQAVATGPGELVVTRAFPSVPVSFWGDPDGTRLRASYFDHFPGVWRHGDWAEFTDHGGVVIHGRSDSTLNAKGVRIGSSELYRYLAGVPEVVEAVAVGQAWAGDSRVVLFLKLQSGAALNPAMIAALRSGIRENVSPRHVPARIVATPDIPVTVTGKVSEAAVHAALHGREVTNRGALANPEALAFFALDCLPELQV